MTQWDFQNKGMLGWTGTSSFVLEVPLRHLRPSVIYSVPCDQILQRAHCSLVLLAYKDISHKVNLVACNKRVSKTSTNCKFGRQLEKCMFFFFFISG